MSLKLYTRLGVIFGSIPEYLWNSTKLLHNPSEGVGYTPSSPVAFFFNAGAALLAAVIVVGFVYVVFGEREQTRA
jgi:hypothetical protein